MEGKGGRGERVEEEVDGVGMMGGVWHFTGLVPSLYC